MKIRACLVAIAAVACVAGLPAAAATHQAPHATEATPLPPSGDDGACPVMTANAALSDTTQGLFAIIANACKLRKAGLIEDYQFQMIRDQAINDIMVQMQTDANTRMSQSLAVIP